MRIGVTCEQIIELYKSLFNDENDYYNWKIRYKYDLMMQRYGISDKWTFDTLLDELKVLNLKQRMDLYKELQGLKNKYA